MKILWFTWKDLTHPQAGGAEVVNEELARRLVKDGHEVTFIVGGYKGGAGEEQHPHGYRIIRLGGRYTVYHKARIYYQKHLKGWADLVIDEVNTMPFFAKFYVREPSILFVHQLCRQIWFYQLWFPLSLIGYLLEPIYMRLLSGSRVITVSSSTRQDLLKVGFKPKKTHIISEGLSIKPLSKLPPLSPKLHSPSSKFSSPTLLSLGAIRPMKRTMDQLKAFEIAKQSIPNLRLEIAGDAIGRYGKKVLRAMESSPYSSDITYHGKVSGASKLRLLRRSHLILQTSVKEGWGLTVTEANSQGTPAIVYNSDGLRDSVRNLKTGLIAKQNNPQSLASEIVTLIGNQKQYAQLRKNAYEWSKLINFEESYLDFIQAIVL